MFILILEFLDIVPLPSDFHWYFREVSWNIYWCFLEVYIIFSLNRQGGLSSLYTQQLYLYSQFPPSLSLYLTQSTCLHPHPRAPTCIPRVLFQKLSFLFFVSKCIYLFELGLSCGTWNLHCVMRNLYSQHTDSNCGAQARECTGFSRCGMWTLKLGLLGSRAHRLSSHGTWA